MKGMLYVGVAFCAMLLIIFLGLLVVIMIEDIRRRKAIANAKWSVYSEIKSNGDVEVGVERVARWGSSRKELARHRLSTVAMTEINDMNDQLAEANVRAAQYNALLQGGK
jgi:hypothetical protein